MQVLLGTLPAKYDAQGPCFLLLEILQDCQSCPAEASKLSMTSTQADSLNPLDRSRNVLDPANTFAFSLERPWRYCLQSPLLPLYWCLCASLTAPCKVSLSPALNSLLKRIGDPATIIPLWELAFNQVIRGGFCVTSTSHWQASTTLLES